MKLKKFYSYKNKETFIYGDVVGRRHVRFMKNGEKKWKKIL